MAAARYKLLFRGKLLAGRDEREVRQQLGGLLKLDQQGLAQLFSGRLITLKRGLLQGEASKYQQLLENVGAEVLLQPDSEAVPPIAEQRATGPIKSGVSNRPEPPSAEDLTCPRCAHSQSPAQHCAHCKMDLRLHIMRLQRKAKARQARLDSKVLAG